MTKFWWNLDAFTPSTCDWLRHWWQMLRLIFSFAYKVSFSAVIWTSMKYLKKNLNRNPGWITGSFHIEKEIQRTKPKFLLFLNVHGFTFWGVSLKFLILWQEQCGSMRSNCLYNTRWSFISIHPQKTDPLIWLFSNHLVLLFSKNGTMLQLARTMKNHIIKKKIVCTVEF